MHFISNVTCDTNFVPESYYSTASVYINHLIHISIIRLHAYLLNALEHLILAVLSYAVLCLILYRVINRNERSTERYESPIRNLKRVLIVIAHPDDECMFFGPTIYKLTHETKCQVYLLCLSRGNKCGLGPVRRNELWKSCEVLGIESSRVYLYDCTLLPDDTNVQWREEMVARLVLQHIESLRIDTVITFDSNGVSKHGNHCSIYYGIVYLAMEKQLPNYCKVYILESINLLRKYWLILDMPLSFILSSHRYVLDWSERNTVLRAMREHITQYIWYRKLYVQFSRYMIINTFQSLDTIDLELELTLDD